MAFCAEKLSLRHSDNLNVQMASNILYKLSIYHGWIYHDIEQNRQGEN